MDIIEQPLNNIIIEPKDNIKKRYFKVVDVEKINNSKYNILKHNILKDSNRYQIKENDPPIYAAKKALTQIFHKTNEFKEYVIILRETTKDSDEKLYFYKGSIQLNPESEWKTIHFKNDNTQKIFKNKINVEIINSQFLGHPNPLSNWKLKKYK